MVHHTLPPLLSHQLFSHTTVNSPPSALHPPSPPGSPRPLRCPAWSTPSFHCYLENSYASLNAQLHGWPARKHSAHLSQGCSFLLSPPSGHSPYMVGNICCPLDLEGQEGEGRGRVWGDRERGRKRIPTRDPADQMKCCREPVDVSTIFIKVWQHGEDQL